MEVTLFGMLIAVNDVHPANALLPMEVTCGILIPVNDVHPENA